MKPAVTKANTSPTWYAIRVEGCLSDRWTEWFEGMTITQENNSTLITGPVVDQAALYGLLKKVRDLGMALISVSRVQAME
jgi:hypothetical protein